MFSVYDSFSFSWTLYWYLISSRRYDLCRLETRHWNLSDEVVHDERHTSDVF